MALVDHESLSEVRGFDELVKSMIDSPESGDNHSRNDLAAILYGLLVDNGTFEDSPVGEVPQTMQREIEGGLRSMTGESRDRLLAILPRAAGLS